MLRRRTLALALLGGVILGFWGGRIAGPRRAPSDATMMGEPRAPAAVGLIKLSDEQVAAAKITVAPAEAGPLTRSILVPALLTPDPDRVAHVPAKVVGTVAELRKRLGDSVQKNEVVAVVDSREVAEAKSEYLAASVNYTLQNSLFLREKGLFEKKITAEQIFLKSKSTFAEARLRLDLARQKLGALDLSEAEISALPQQDVVALRQKDIRAPMAGRVTERLVSLGQPVGGEGQSKELYVISDLFVVEADLAVPVADLPFVREGEEVKLETPDGREVKGVIVFVNGVLTPETRTGHAIARFDNADGRLRPGSLLNARIIVADNIVPIRAPRSAFQTINAEPSVFVRVAEGFAKRKVDIGASNDAFVEIRAGLSPGEPIATSNTFLLKAELGKAEIPAQ